jgi:predicted metal-dependent hydrolase
MTGKRWKDSAEFRVAVDRWAGQVGVTVREVHLRPMKRKWASYSVKAGRMTFDTGLLKVDREFGEYVILHEVLHVKVPNHGRLFKGMMTAMMPGWKRIKDCIDNMEPKKNWRGEMIWIIS